MANDYGVFSGRLDNIPVFDYMPPELCCGCEACAEVCPKKIISFEEDKEGFVYPHTMLAECIHCNLCVAVCPRLKPIQKLTYNVECYGGYAKDNRIVLSSSSGGLYSVFVKRFKDMFPNGAFAGVTWGNGFKTAEFIITDKIENLEKLKVSKYIQAHKKGIYAKVKEKLLNQIPVLFAGCPCEVAALKSYLGKLASSNLLYTIDFVCKGPTSDKVMREYLESISSKESPTAVNLRVVGRQPWIPQWMMVKYKRRTVFTPFYSSSLGVAFHIMQRKSCYECTFCGKNRYSDITLGDFHGADPSRMYYNADGTSAILVNSEKGMDMMRSILDSCVVEKVSYDEISAHNPRVEQAWEPDSRREVFSRALADKGLKAAYRLVVPLKRRIKNFVCECFYEVSYKRSKKR